MMKTADFAEHRDRLWRIAYGMLGSTEDAEDLVQETYLRWHRADDAQVRHAEAWLVTVVTRLAIDRLRHRRAERQAYVGPWLPGPLISPPVPADRAAELASELSLAFLLMLERLTPEERVALLLRDVFDVRYPAISAALDRTEAACRQLVHRARKRVRSDRSRFEATPAAVEALAGRFTAAVQAGDHEALVALLTEDATLVTDGGGEVWAARRVIHGADRVARAVLGAARKRTRRGAIEERPVLVNGAPGIVTYQDGAVVAVTAFDVRRGRVAAVLRILNPAKLPDAAA